VTAFTSREVTQAKSIQALAAGHQSTCHYKRQRLCIWYFPLSHLLMHTSGARIWTLPRYYIETNHVNTSCVCNPTTSVLSSRSCVPHRFSQHHRFKCLQRGVHATLFETSHCRKFHTMFVLATSSLSTLYLLTITSPQEPCNAVLSASQHFIHAKYHTSALFDKLGRQT
jgi:hypothetical protein